MKCRKLPAKTSTTARSTVASLPSRDGHNDLKAVPIFEHDLTKPAPAQHVPIVLDDHLRRLPAAAPDKIRHRAWEIHFVALTIGHDGCPVRLHSRHPPNLSRPARSPFAPNVSRLPPANECRQSRTALSRARLLTRSPATAA